MARLTLVNPGRRVKRRKNTAKRRTRRAVSTRVRSNPIRHRRTRRAVRRNPIFATRRRHTRRRRNPVSLRKLGSSTFVKMLMNAAIGGAGAVGMDAVMAQVNKYLPASLQPTAGSPGLNDVVKFALTVLIGHFGSKATKGYSQIAASGALAVQAADILRPMVAAQVAPATAAGMGYANPARTFPGTARIGPNMRAYSTGKSPLLAAYSPGASPLLSARAGSMSPKMRDAMRR